MPTYRVDVEPEVLIWARKQVGLDEQQAADELGVDKMTLRYWEAGAYTLAQPTLVQLRKMARVYQVPLPALYLPSPPDEPTPKPPDLRSLIPGTDPTWSLALHAAFRRALKQREVAVELAALNDQIPESLGLVLDGHTPPDVVGAEVRAWLGVSLGDQLSWKDEYQALNAWSVAIEAKGILVTHSSNVQLEEMRGMAVGEEPFPVIVLNGYDKPRGRIFTLMHELTHVLMRTGSLCDLSEARPKPHDRRGDIETYCNQVAGAVLLPRALMVDIALDHQAAREQRWSDRALASVANRYNVSREVVLRRMVSIGHATLDDYFIKLRRYNREYEEQREKERLERERRRQEGLPPIRRGDTLRTRLRNFGRRYTGQVLSAYGRRQIDAAELTEYLETGPDLIPDLVRLLERRP